MKKSSLLYTNDKNRFINTSLPSDDNNNAKIDDNNNAKIDLEDGFILFPVRGHMSNVPEYNSQQLVTTKVVSDVSENGTRKVTLKVVSAFDKDNQKMNNIKTTCNEKVVPCKKKKPIKKHSYIVSKNQLLLPQQLQNIVNDDSKNEDPENNPQLQSEKLLLNQKQQKSLSQRRENVRIFL